MNRRMNLASSGRAFQSACCAGLIFIMGAGHCMAQITNQPVIAAKHNEYMKLLRRHIASHYVTQLQTQGLWTIQGKDPRSQFWMDERKRQEGLGGLGPEPTTDEITDLMVGLPDGVVYDFMNTIHMADQNLKDFIEKQDRLIGLVNTVSSEIKIIDACERTGKTGLNDYQYLLTIDDGPSPDNQTWILKELEAENVKAIFFLIGEQAKKVGMDPKPYIGMGHDVGMHTSVVDFEYDPTCMMIDPLMERKWFRAHGGSRDMIYTGKIRDEGGLHLLWNVDSRDWEFVGFIGGTEVPGSIEEHVDRVVASAVAVSLVRGTGIVLFHETVQLAPEIIGRYVRVMKALGCDFVTPEAAWKGFQPEPATIRPVAPDGL